MIYYRYLLLYLLSKNVFHLLKKKGKSGKNVRELQRSTGATIKLPEDLNTGASSGQDQDKDQSSEQTSETTAEPVSTTPPPPASTEEASATSEKPAATTEEPLSTTSDPNQPPSSNTTPNAQGFVIVRIFGTFQASQCAQRRIQSLVTQSLRPAASQSNTNGSQFNSNHSISNSANPANNGHYNGGPSTNSRVNGGPYNGT